jgi:type II secretory pathway pseudopilin PulG
MPKKRATRKYFTLLELLLVVAILIMISGFIGINVRKAVHEQQFKAEIARIEDELKLAQDLMLLLRTDVHLKFTSKSKDHGIDYWMEAEGLPEHLSAQVQRPRKPLRAVHSIEFHDELPGWEQENAIDLKFLSGGSLMSRGIMRLTDSPTGEKQDGTLERYICFPGYPSPLHSTVNTGENPACKKDREKSIEESLTLFTKTEISDKSLKKEATPADDSKKQPEKISPQDRRSEPNKGLLKPQ